MSKLSDLQFRRCALQDIEGILRATKNLSHVEITKISRFYVTQQELFHTVESALADFQPPYDPKPGKKSTINGAVLAKS